MRRLLHCLAGRVHLDLVGYARLGGLVIRQELASAIGACGVDAARLHRLVVDIRGLLALVSARLRDLILHLARGGFLLELLVNLVTAHAPGSGGAAGTGRGAGRRLDRHPLAVHTHQLGSRGGCVAVLHVTLGIDRFENVGQCRGERQPDQNGNRGGTGHGPSPASECEYQAILYGGGVTGVTFNSAWLQTVKSASGRRGERAHGRCRPGMPAAYSILSPCSEMSRPSRSSSGVTRSPIVRSISFRMTMLMTKP